MPQQRSEARFLCADLVKIQIRTDRKRFQTVANLEDISPSGACLQLEEAVAEGAKIEIICARCRLRGQVRYCRFADTGYQVGVQFHKPKLWNFKKFEPRHFLDMAILGISIARRQPPRE
jgi:hypothetical protein